MLSISIYLSKSHKQSKDNGRSGIIEKVQAYLRKNKNTELLEVKMLIEILHKSNLLNKQIRLSLKKLMLQNK